MNNLWKHVALLVIILFFILAGCSTTNPAASPAPESEPEAIARTEFTDRVENFFEYEPLQAGKPSQVRIHLTDLSDGSPVEKAEVKLIVRSKGGSETLQTTARVGKVTGIYVADLNIPLAGEYDIEFQIKNTKLDERMPLTNFKVEQP
jgi:5-hydroxyisourate hydrolase-like protein (transthyretin family)